MTQDERNALISERTELQRLYRKRKDVPGFGANAAKLLERIEAIDAALDAPLSPIASLAGQVLGDDASPPNARSLASRVLNGSGD
jgi:hypothetical protein